MLSVLLLFLCSTVTNAGGVQLYEVHFASWSGDRVRQLSLRSEIRQMDQSQQLLQCALVAAKQLLTDQLLVFIGGDGGAKEPQCILANKNAGLCRKLMPTPQPPCCIRVFVTSLNNCWISIQRRIDDSLDFLRNWTEYTLGFGQGPHTNHWIGLQILHSLTWPSGRAFRIRMKLWNDTEYWAHYSYFSVDSESNKFKLSVSGFHSSHPSIGNELNAHNGMYFTTIDRDNDIRVHGNCANIFKGAFWYRECLNTNPNGLYYTYPSALTAGYADGIVWFAPFGNHYSMMEIELLTI